MENNQLLKQKAKENSFVVFVPIPNCTIALLNISGLSDKIEMNVHDGK